MNIEWYEVWADETQTPPYILLVRPAANRFDIFDPAEGYKIVRSFDDYQEMSLWLSEDEYVLLTRQEIDRG